MPISQNGFMEANNLITQAIKFFPSPKSIYEGHLKSICGGGPLQGSTTKNGDGGSLMRTASINHGQGPGKAQIGLV